MPKIRHDQTRKKSVVHQISSTHLVVVVVVVVVLRLLLSDFRCFPDPPLILERIELPLRVLLLLLLLLLCRVLLELRLRLLLELFLESATSPTTPSPADFFRFRLTGAPTTTSVALLLASLFSLEFFVFDVFFFGFFVVFSDFFPTSAFKVGVVVVVVVSSNTSSFCSASSFCSLFVSFAATLLVEAVLEDVFWLV